MRRSVRWFWVTGLCFSAAIAFAQDVVLKGAGASFPDPLYQQWIDRYSAQSGERIFYESVGSGEGIRRLLCGEVDFGATDAFISDRQMKDAPGEVFHMPTCAGAVVLAYNLPDQPQLRLTGRVIADIFMRKIRNWSHASIQELNPGIRLPNLDIVVLHRADSSGTTFVFTDYLGKVSPEWEHKVGRGKDVRWPTGLGMERNGGIADFITRIPGSIGYLEYGYARRQGLPCAAIRNRSGWFAGPSEKTITAAADVDIPDDTRVMITDTTAPKGYPVSTFTWLIFQRTSGSVTGSPGEDRQLHAFLDWILGPGQNQFGGLHYAPLPNRVVDKAQNIVHSMFETGSMK